MSRNLSPPTEIFSEQDIARVAGVSHATVRALIQRHRVPAVNGYLPAQQAVRCVKLLRRAMAEVPRRSLFAPPAPTKRSPVAGAVSSAAVHAGVVGIVILATSLGVASRTFPTPQRTGPSRMVFLATPGPGGGGGGGGLKQPVPPPTAKMKSAPALRSPVPPPRRLTTQKPEPTRVRPTPPPVPVASPRIEEPPASAPIITPQVVAPVASASTDTRDRAGLLAESPREADTQGGGSGGGAGSGQGTGIGEGTGSGIGPGSGGGTGGGPYRPGSGITAPDLLREVRPDYTDDARRLGIEGEVVLEIIVRADGSVGDVRVVQGLRGGLDRRAVDAVRQWRFSPARRHGVPVDVVVEVAIEFKLR